MTYALPIVLGLAAAGLLAPLVVRPLDIVASLIVAERKRRKRERGR